MKYYSSYMIRCIVKKKDIEKDLQQYLSLQLHNSYSHFSIKLYYQEKYWKEEGEFDLIYCISHKNFMKIGDILQVFAVSWEYREGVSLHPDTREKFLDEWAVWSKLSYPQEIFVEPAVEWVNIYTWPHDEIS